MSEHIVQSSFPTNQNHLHAAFTLDIILSNLENSPYGKKGKKLE